MAYTSYTDYFDRIDPKKVAEEIRSSIKLQPPQQANTEEQESTLDRLKRLGKAALAHGVVEPLAGILDIPGALHLPGTEPGIWTRQAKEWESSLGLKGTTEEYAAGLLGSLIGYALPYTGAAKGLEAIGTALGAAKTGQLLGEVAPVVTRAVEGYEALHPAIQVGIREGARGAGVWAMTEAPKPKEYRTPAGEFIASDVAGGVGFHLLGKLLSRATRGATKASHGVLEGALHQPRTGEVPPVDSVVKPVRTTMPNIENAAFQYAKKLRQSGLPDDQVHKVVFSELMHPEVGLSVDDAYEMTTRVLNKHRLLSEARTNAEIKEAAAELAKMRLGRGETLEQVKRSIVDSIQSEFNKTPKQAAMLADDALKQFGYEASPTLTKAEPINKLSESELTGLIAKSQELRDFWLSKASTFAPDSTQAKNAAVTARNFDNLIKDIQQGNISQAAIDVINKFSNKLAQVKAKTQPTEYIAKAEALLKYWENKAGNYRKTNQGLVDAVGEHKTYTRINEERAAKKVALLNNILKALQEGRATGKQLKTLNELWNTRTKTKAGREEMSAFGYNWPERVVAQEKTSNTNLLPKDLAGAKPRFAYGSKQFTPIFESDVYKALYIVAQTHKSKRDADYILFLQKVFPGATEAELRSAGQAVRSYIKGLAKTSEPGSLHIPRTGIEAKMTPTKAVESASAEVISADDVADIVRSAKESGLEYFVRSLAKQGHSASDIVDLLVKQGSFSDDMRPYLFETVKYILSSPHTKAGKDMLWLRRNIENYLDEPIRNASNGIREALDVQGFPNNGTAYKEAINFHRLYTLYKYAESKGKYELTFDEVKDILGYADKKDAKELLGWSSSWPMNNLIKVEFVADLDNIYLNRNITTADLLHSFKAGGFDAVNALGFTSPSRVSEGSTKVVKDMPNIGETYTAKMLQNHGAVVKAGKEYTGKVVRIDNGRVVLEQANGKHLAIPVEKAEWHTTEVPKDTRLEELYQSLADQKAVDYRELSKLDLAKEKSVDDIADYLQDKGLKILFRPAKDLANNKEVVRRNLADVVLDEITQGGSKVNMESVAKHKYIENGYTTVGEVYQAAKARGIEVEGAEEKLYAGVPVQNLFDTYLKAMDTRKRRKYISVFNPIRNVTNETGSLRSFEMKKLPPDLREKIAYIDKNVARLNASYNWLKNKHRLLHPGEEESPELLDKLDKIQAKLDKWGNKRNALRKAVEKALYGEELTTRTNKRIINRLQTGETTDNIPVVLGDKQVGYFVESVKPGKEDFIPIEGTSLDVDRSFLQTSPSWYAKVFGAERDVFGEDYVRPLRNAERLKQTFEHKYAKKLYDILKPVWSRRFNDAARKRIRERITFILEGDIPKNVTKLELNIAKRLREEFYNPLFKEFGLDPDRFLKDYAPHIRQAGSIKEAFGGNVPRELTFFAELERSGTFFPYETDALIAAAKYLRYGARKKFFDPVLAEVLPKAAKEMRNPNRLNHYLNLVSYALGRPVEEEIVFNATLSATKQALEDILGRKIKSAGVLDNKRLARDVSSWINRLVYMSTLGANPKSALTNLTQNIVSMAVLDPNPLVGAKYMLQAWRDMRTATGKKLLRYNWVAQHRAFLEGLEKLHGTNRVINATEKVLMWPFEMADLLNVNTAYMMKLRYALERKVPLAEAIENANKFAADTQFMYGMDSSRIYKHPLGRVLGVLTSYPVNFTRLLWMHLKSNSPGDKVKVANLIGSMALATWALSQTGIDFSRESPFATIASHPIPAAVNLLFGHYVNVPEYLRPSIRGADADIPTLKAIGQIAGEAINMATSAHMGDVAGQEKAFKKLKQRLMFFLPASTEVKRIMKFIDAVKNDWDVADVANKSSYRMGEILSDPTVSTGSPAMIGWFGKYLPGGILYQLTDGNVPGEAIRTMIGPTTEQQARYAKHVEYSKERAYYGDLHAAALNNYMRYLSTKDQKYYRAFRKLQKQIQDMGGNPITKADVRKKLKEQQLTALQRHRRMLTKNYKEE